MDDVIAALAGWRREHSDDGAALIAPAGDVRLRVRPRLRWKRLSDLLADSIAAAGELAGGDATVAREPIERLVTNEGESGAVTSARVAGTARTLHVAVSIAGDDPLGCVEAVATLSTASPSEDTSVRTLVTRVIEHLELGLGVSRRRPFGYIPPPKWIGLRRFGATIWLHPEYPRVSARITMFDARAFGDAAVQRLDRLLFMELPGLLDEARPLPSENLQLACELPAQSSRVDGKLAGRGAVTRCAASAADDRFLYAGHFEGPSVYIPNFHDVFTSLEPIPHRHRFDPLT